MSEPVPITAIDVGLVTASLFRQERGGKLYYTARFHRIFKDDFEKWSYGTTYSPQDLLLLAKAVELAQAEIAKLRAADRPHQLAEDEDQ